ncbi:MAG: DUF2652 domain-containing protein [Anaerolineae bacterium]|nr:DUF2652 domain-containing protein [Anaerolineae bacterium]
MATQQGYFLIADITGYTNYLSKSELEHAQQTLTALLSLLVQHTKPPLVISRLAGDAVISYGLRDNFLQGQTFVEMIEDTYVAFRRAIDLMVLNTTCTCNACANIRTLDLKFFVHYGSFGIQKLDAHDEMVGADVIVIHRLLKNTVTETTGIRAYALYTDAAIKQLGLEDICEKMIAHKESYEHLGDLSVWIQDMHPVWVRKKEAVNISIPPEQLVFEVEADIHLPMEIVWDYLTQPKFRTILIASDRQEIEGRKDGRVDEGSVYVCYHGTQATRQTVVLWKPLERMITQDLIPIPIPNTSVYVEYRLTRTEGGTRLAQAVSKAITGPFLGRLLVNTVMPTKRKEFDHDIQKFKRYIEEDFARRDSLPESMSPTPEMVAAAVSESMG